MHRRKFLKAASIATAGALLPSLGPQAARADQTAAGANVRAKSAAGGGLRVLMLGGTRFLGPTIVQGFLDRGHQVTLFNRGITNPHLFTYLERLRGDREAPGGDDLDALRGREWDVVVDTWKNGPQCVEDTARLLSGHAGMYMYISTIAVYKSWDHIGTEESARLSDLEGQTVTRKPDLEYFVRKTLAEKLVSDHFDGAVAKFRSHGMRGSRIAATNDEPYWPVRVWRGGDVLAPGDGKSWGQFTDTISLCRFLVRCAENSISGAFNVMSPPFHLEEYLSAIQRVTQSDANFIWIPRETLARHGVQPYKDLPMWRPEPAGFYRFSTGKAVQAGFRHRPLDACIASMLEGYTERHPKDGFKFGGSEFGTLAADREARILRSVLRR